MGLKRQAAFHEKKKELVTERMQGFIDELKSGLPGDRQIGIGDICHG